MKFWLGPTGLTLVHLQRVMVLCELASMGILQHGRVHEDAEVHCGGPSTRLPAS